MSTAGSSHHRVPMPLPFLAPHVQIAWRDAQQLLLEDPAAPQAQVLVGNATSATVQWLRMNDGSRTLDEVLRLATEHGIDRDSARELLNALAKAGLLSFDAAPRELAEDQAMETRSPLRQDLDALALSGRNAAEAWTRRQEHHISIEGVNRVAHALVDVLAASHIGSMQVLARSAARRSVTLRDIEAFGPMQDDVGVQSAVALKRHIERVMPERKLRTVRHIAIACDARVSPGDEAPFQERGIPYLRLLVTSRYATIGPLTLPGHSVCWSCIELHRTDADPQWPHSLAQFEAHRRYAAPIDDTFAMWVASETAAQVLRVIDTDDPSSLVNTTLHIDRATAGVRRRTWNVHPQCPCQWRWDQAA